MNIEVTYADPKPTYSERLLPSFWSFFMAAIVFPSAYLVFLPINASFGFALGAALTAAIWAVMFFTSAKIEVAHRELKVGGAHIPVKYLENAIQIKSHEAFEARGPGLDARAFVRFQMGVKGLVRFDNTDPEDPTPYWLFSTRNAEALIVAVRGQKAKN